MFSQRDWYQRLQLNDFGFSQPLPIGATPVASQPVLSSEAERTSQAFGRVNSQTATQRTLLTNTCTQSSLATQELDFHGFLNIANAAVDTFPTSDELEQMHDEFSPEQLTCLLLIRDAVMNLVAQVSDKSSRARPKSIYLRCERVMPPVGRQKKPQVVPVSLRCNMSNLRPLAIKLRVLEIVFNMILTQTYATKRDIFYKHKSLFGTQASVDRTITDVCGFLHVDRGVLNVQSCSRGSVMGRMTLIMNDQRVDCSSTPISIMQNFLSAEFETNATFILVVEKDTVFQRLIDDDFFVHFPDGILVTGRGFPDIVTRQFLKRVQVSLGKCIYGLFDCDPHGLHIALTYKYGSVSHKCQIEAKAAQSKVSALQLIGLRPSHLSRFVNELHGIPFTRTDVTTINFVKKRSLEVHDQTIYNEACILAEMRMKVELDSVSTTSPHFMISYLQDCRKRMPWVLESDDVAKSTPLIRKSSEFMFVDE